MRRSPSAGLDSLNVSHAMSVTENLSAYFRSYLQGELPGYRTRFELERQDAFLRTSFSTVKSVLGVVPVIGTVVGMRMPLEVVLGGPRMLSILGPHSDTDLSQPVMRVQPENGSWIIYLIGLDHRRNRNPCRVRELHNLAL